MVFRQVMPRTYHRLRRNLVGPTVRPTGRGRCDGISLRVPAHIGRAAVGGTTWTSRSTTTSFRRTGPCWTPKTWRSTNDTRPEEGDDAVRQGHGRLAERPRAQARLPGQRRGRPEAARSGLDGAAPGRVRPDRWPRGPTGSPRHPSLAIAPRCRQDGGVPKPTEKDAAASETNGSRSQGSKPRKGTEVVAPSSRVNVVSSFSHIKLQEPSQELAIWPASCSIWLSLWPSGFPITTGSTSSGRGTGPARRLR